MRTSRLLAAAWGPAALVVGAVAFAVATRASATAVVKIDASEPLSEVGELFMGMTTDWWLDFPDAPYAYKWSPKGGILQADLDARMAALVRGLAPAMWRIGGTPADTVVYEFGSPPECAVHVENPYPGTKCLSAQRWGEILAFAKSTGVSLSFGLSGLYGRASPAAPMNITNAASLLSATAAMSSNATEALLAFQLGNELGNGDSKDWKAEPQVLAADSNRIRGVINSQWAGTAGAAARRPLLVGPDSGYSDAFYGPFLDAGAYSLNATTYHSYVCGSRHGGGGPCQAALLSAKGIANDDSGAHHTLSAAARSPVPGLPVWGGEVGPAYGGGVTGLSNRFGDMVWWVDHLARLQAIGVQAFDRSTLIGGSYELVNRSTHLPNPSYFAALAYHRLMGGRSLTASLSGNEDMVAYSACTAFGRGREAVAAAAASGTKSLVLSRAGATGATVHEHVFPGQASARAQRDSALADSPCSEALSPSSGGVTAVAVNINGISPAAVSVGLAGADVPPGSTACVWQFRSGAAASTSGEPLYASETAEWLDGATGNWTRLAMGPSPGFALPAMATPQQLTVASGKVVVALGPFEFAFVVFPATTAVACKA
ncbi:hypothetical protein FNF29_05151 [Cafeteria roenbergensis]|uniref:Beta-glucuronidase C-terminal domain-containing protein n=1 Tax=Cafeteria roenbergensis TaxID=33653 RepID=A0A5A8CBW6_CAFRO|nr:hypothetical protein FNF29_05151 [Cafeteria roenbergensis]|eukprot:KAA0150576.1 hypothetical protein FNF29_05151 [Cafeteria roenbergensis]